MNTVENQVKTDALAAKAGEIGLTVLKVTGQIVVGLAKMAGSIVAGLYVVAAKSNDRSPESDWTEADAQEHFLRTGTYIEPEKDTH